MKRIKKKKIELLKYEIEEIESVNFLEGEDEKLKAEIKIFENYEIIIGNLQEIQKIFSNEVGIINKLKSGKNLFNQTADIDPSYLSLSDEISDLYYKLEDISSQINNKLSYNEYDSAKLDALIERAESIEKVKRKYGDNYHNIIKHLKGAKEELDLINFSTEEKNRLKNELSKKKEEFINIALILSKKRKDGAKILEEKVENVLIKLAMNNVEFKINITYEQGDIKYLIINNQKTKYWTTGIDRIEFLISPNKGEPLKNLIKIASGGELSRIILALKTVLVENDTINTMIFDEIDAGIGGKVAIYVSKNLKNLSRVKQIICITHLPQIAAVGDNNFLIEKELQDGRTITNIKLLEKNGKINEISRMLSGNITQTSINHAKELINLIN